MSLSGFSVVFGINARFATRLRCLLLGVALASSAAQADDTVAKPESLGFSSSRLEGVNRYLEWQVASGHLPGVSVLVLRHGKTVLRKTYGNADGDSGVALKEDDLFRVYSMTKPITGVALMMLYEEGKWRFDDPITKFIPEFKQLQVFKGLNADGSLQLEPARRPPTMRELVTHTAGFAYGLGTDNPVDKGLYEADFMRARNADDAIGRIAKWPLLTQPGTHWNYSASVDLQGYIIERISGQSLAQFMQSRIFVPLKMSDTAFYVPAEKSKRLVRLKGYDATAHKLVDAQGILVFDYSKQPGAPSGGAGLVSTLSDYSRFAQMLVNRGELEGVRLLSPSTVDLLATNHIADAVRAIPQEGFSAASGHGFGVDVSVVMDPAKAATTQGAGTFGWGGAAGTWVWIDPTNDLICVGMIQVMDRWTDPQLQSIDSDVSQLVYAALVNPKQ
jgi:CubicO group peptidase (beta-lactamase class C family)